MKFHSFHLIPLFKNSLKNLKFQVICKWEQVVLKSGFRQKTPAIQLLKTLKKYIKIKWQSQHDQKILLQSKQSQLQKNIKYYLWLQRFDI